MMLVFQILLDSDHEDSDVNSVNEQVSCFSPRR